MRRFCGGGTPCLERWKAFIFAATSCGRPPALAAANEDGGGPGLLAALIAPRGFNGAFAPANVSDSVTARYEGGRTFSEEGSDGAKSEVLVEADKSKVGEAAELVVDSGESSGEPMTAVLWSRIEM